MSEYDTNNAQNTGAEDHPSDYQRPTGSGKRPYLDFRDWWDDRRVYQKVLVVLGFVILGAGAIALFGWIIMALWNWLMPDIFGLKEISYWQAWGLFLLSSLLFKGMGSEESSKPSDRRRKRRIKRYIRQTGEDVSREDRE